MKLLSAAIYLALAAVLPAQDWAQKQLEKSPRHHEWVKIRQGDREIHSFLVFPEEKEKRAVVLVIHENRGLTDWVRTVADQFAAAGYIAIAPDLLSGMAPNKGKTSDFEGGDGATKAIYALPPDQVTADLNAVFAYAQKIPAANGKVAVGGFCWGGAQTFRFATNNKDVAAAFVFYGTGPEKPSDIERINCPVYGFYGGSDARVNATIPGSEEMMKAKGKKFEPVIYPDAGHGFMRSGEEPEAKEPNKVARDKAWARLKEILKKI